jgi:hypothetical protein
VSPIHRARGRAVAAAVACLALALASGCGRVEYPFHDVDATQQAVAALPGCAAQLRSAHPVPAVDAYGRQPGHEMRTAAADLDGDGRAESVVLAYRYHELDMRADSDAVTETGRVHAQPPGLSAAQRRAVPKLRSGGWAGLLVTTSTGAVRAVALPTHGGNAGDIGGSARLQLVDGRLYVDVFGGVWRVDARAVRAGHVGAPFVSVELPIGWNEDIVTVLADCQGAGRDAVMVNATHHGPPEEDCPFGGGDQHAPQQFGLWAFTPHSRLLVRSQRIADEALGCNS